MIKKYFFLFILLLMTTDSQAKDCVILLHGLARTESSMNKMSRELSNAGYEVINQGYPSTQRRIEVLSMETIPLALQQCQKVQKIHFVTHSMGGILLRHYLSQENISNLGRVVMLGPPNHGSEVVGRLQNTPGFKWLNGPAGLQLGTESTSIPNSLGPVKFDLGVIAGTRSVNLILSCYLPNPDDGKVSVASTKVQGMRHHISMPVTHTFMMRNKRVISQVKHYLQNGHFKSN